MKKSAALLLSLLLMASSLFAQNESTTCGPRFKQTDQNTYLKAVAAYQNKKYMESRETMHKISAKYPSAPDPYFYLGMMSVKKDYNVAGIRKYFTKLLALCPDYPHALAHYYMGLVNYTDENYEAAVANLNRYFDITNQQRLPEYESVYEEASNYLYWSQFLEEATRNKAPFNPHVMLGVSSKENEYLPYLTPDGKYMYYLRDIPEDKSVTFYKKELVSKLPRLCISQRRDTSFTEGSELPAPFNMTNSEGGITLTVDGKSLYYSIMRNKNGYANCDIYASHLVNGKWSKFESASPNINGDKSWESQPSVTPDGQYLYFASNREGGLGGTDIWRCHRLPNGDWSRAENLGPSVNTSGNEKCPFIHADGKTLYFASDGWQGFGGYDMYFINVNDTYLQRPANMGLPINSENDEICFGVNTAGDQAYYAGKAPDGVPFIGGTDILFFELYPAARPEPMTLCEGRLLTSEGKGVPGSLAVYRVGANKAEYLSDSASGAVVAMLSMQEDNLLVAQSDNYMPSVNLLPAAQVRKDPSTALGGLSLRKLRKDGRYVVQGISLTGTTLSRPSRMIIDAYIAFLREHPMVHVRIEGVSDKSVKLVYDYMLSQKLRKERLSTKVGGTAELQFVVTQF